MNSGPLAPQATNLTTRPFCSQSKNDLMLSNMRPNFSPIFILVALLRTVHFEKIPLGGSQLPTRCSKPIFHYCPPKSRSYASCILTVRQENVSEWSTLIWFWRNVRMVSRADKDKRRITTFTEWFLQIYVEVNEVWDTWDLWDFLQLS